MANIYLYLKNIQNCLKIDFSLYMKQTKHNSKIPKNNFSKNIFFSSGEILITVCWLKHSFGVCGSLFFDVKKWLFCWQIFDR